MNKANVARAALVREESADAEVQRERLSALVDGELAPGELNNTLVFASQGDGRATWEMYQLVGDVLRSSDLARPANPAFMSRLREQLAKEEPLRPAVAVPVAQVATPGADTAANASVFRWKMLAGFASMAAVAAIGWSSMSALQQDGHTGAGAQLAQSDNPAATVGAGAAPTVAVADAENQQVMIRDPRLDELLAAHKQFGSTSALQMPAGFLRNATFEAPHR